MSNSQQETPDVQETAFGGAAVSKQRRIIHFSSGETMEEEDGDEEEEEEEEEEDSSDGQNVIDVADSSCSVSSTADQALIPGCGHSTCDFLGERLAAALGLNAAKYQYAIDQYHHDHKMKSSQAAHNQRGGQEDAETFHLSSGLGRSRYGATADFIPITCAPANTCNTSVISPAPTYTLLRHRTPARLLAMMPTLQHSRLTSSVSALPDSWVVSLRLPLGICLLVWIDDPPSEKTRQCPRSDMASLHVSSRAAAALIGVLLVLKARAAPTHTGDVDADAGELRDDILEINKGLHHLFEGDIAGDPARNAILDQTRRWKFPIPYILTDSLELNAKGVILQAFEEYRLRSCVDFKPYEGEASHISFAKLSGCWSFVGDDKKGQNVSIGARCDTKSIVQHELLHALGFYHEQSRSDRDDYVKIWWDQIEEGMEHNFDKYADDFITDLNTAYDYESIMHYRPLSFNKNESIPTITTTIPHFNEVIGQRLDFSAVDITRLNRMYDCANTLTLLDQCSFEMISICGMIQSEVDDADWVHVLSSPGDTDHTLGGRCRDSGYFMKFDTSSGTVGASGLLESRILYPKRNEQCLQFFYKMSGAAGDRLVIWIRADDGTGTVSTMKKIHTITGDGVAAWKIANVTLKMTEKFRYVFQGIRGSSNSSGAILVDDVTLTETVCPNAVWLIQNFTNLLAISPPNSAIKSQCFSNSEGYFFGINVHPNVKDGLYQDYVGMTVHLCSGENDAVMEWPVKNRQISIVAVDQDADVKLRMSSTRSLTTDIHPRWNRPTSSSGASYDHSCQCYRGPNFGWSAFISHKHLQSRSFLKNDDLIITADFNDLTHLINTEVPVIPSDGTGEVETRQESLKYRETQPNPVTPSLA
ncbi:meprin A subunit alpha [Brachionichthys hirsutus]|uniref:meprin A subunit alpha n=1 Tax=Brachionichthys hirsutus TaxID=412623 RepID=UPI003604ECF0